MQEYSTESGSFAVLLLRDDTASRWPLPLAMSQTFIDYFRCPAEFADFRVPEGLSEKRGFFRFGAEGIGYGRLPAGQPENGSIHHARDVASSTRIEDQGCYLPFDPDEVVRNLRLERYIARSSGNGNRATARKIMRNSYYALRPLLPVAIRKHLQRAALRGWDQRPFPRWPVDHSVDAILETMMVMSLEAHQAERIPFVWFWPEGQSACATMTHDIETAQGRDFCPQLMDLNDSFGIKSSFQVVPEERYSVPDEFLATIRRRGFEVNVHDLNHDGKLFEDREEFLRRAAQINRYAKKFCAAGYRSGVLYRNLDWYEAFEISYDMSVPNVGHLDPQPGGCCTTKPFFIGKILEIPVTATQDYTLFNILEQYSTDLWREQVRRILERHGLASFIVHPDYVLEPRARNTYRELLAHLAQLRRTSNLWTALPGEVNEWWRARSEMMLRKQGERWVIEGPGKDRARVAFARLENGRLAYELPAVQD